MQTAGLSLDQAPPLSIPTSFFLTAPVALLLAGVYLGVRGGLAMTSPWLPQSLALTHLGTLGVLGAVMFGALYQMTPIVAGTPVPAIRSAHLVHALLVLGLGGFLWRLEGGPPAAMLGAGHTLALAFTLFVLPVGFSLARAAVKNETVWGMRLALLCLVGAAVLGVLLSRGHAGKGFPSPRPLVLEVHLVLALLGWVGCLIASVSWQVIPMFYLAESTPPWAMRTILGLVALSAVLAPAVLFADTSGEGWLAPTRLASLAALPAALAVWALHPWLSLRGIARRKRKRPDGSLLFWKTGLCVAFSLLPAAATAHFVVAPRWALLFGWLAIWGWAGLIVHGMLTRIVPFLVWFHRLSPLIGRVKVPSMRSLLSQRRIKIGYGLHVASLASGTLGIVLVNDVLARLTGVLLAATGVALGSALIHVLRQRAPAHDADVTPAAPAT